MAEGRIMNWFEWLIQNEILVRLGFFFGVFALIAIWEIRSPSRVLTVSKTLRWINNLGLVFLNSIVLRLLFPTAAVGVAIVVEQKEMGLINLYEIPTIFAVFITVVAMDLVIYLQHVMVHAIPVLWRLHRVHHADLDYDVTTGSRFHPIEIVLSACLKIFSIALLGTPVIAVIIFEILLNISSMFNHSNVYIPPKIDRILRFIIVTPDMHRVHHSVHKIETNSNYGFNIPWWDRLFGTYRAQPEAGHIEMKIGLNEFQGKKIIWLHWLLWQPFMSVERIPQQALEDKI